jgi:signal transduction histidine kinase
MASVLAKEEVWPARNKRGLLPSVRPVTTLLATGIVWITGLLVACSIAAGYLRQQVLNTTTDELKRLDTVIAEAASRSFQGLDPTLESLADRLRRRSDGTTAGFRIDTTAPEIAALLQQAIEQSQQFDAIALVGADGKMLRTIGRWPTDLVDIADNKFFTGPAGSARLVGVPLEDPATGTFRLPLARRIDGDPGVTIGAIIGMAPVARLAAIFETVPLAENTAITVLGTDGRLLARYPQPPGRGESGVIETELRPIFADSGNTTIRQVVSDQQEWRIEAIRPLAGYPLAVSISRGAATALADWTRQVFVVGFFAIGGAMAIGVMMYLIAKQIRAHDELAAMRAEKLEAERARLEAETKLLKIERLAVLGQVTGAVAHELRTPLIALRETLAALKEMIADSGSELERPVARMERSIERCDRMSSDLLEYTRTRDIQPTTVGFDQWLGDVIAEQKGWVPFKLSAELRAGNATASFDPDRIQRLLLDLIENACQAMDDMPANYEKRITVRTGVAPGMVVLTVIDTGPGIPPDDHAHIFEPLFSTKSYGTGLGLSIVKQIVDQHDGIIRIDSEVGHGTRVRVCLPLAAEVIPPELRAAA